MLQLGSYYFYLEPHPGAQFNPIPDHNINQLDSPFLGLAGFLCLPWQCSGSADVQPSHSQESTNHGQHQFLVSLFRPAQIDTRLSQAKGAGNLDSLLDPWLGNGIGMTCSKVPAQESSYAANKSYLATIHL